jgi:hypothetical protein
MSYLKRTMCNKFNFKPGGNNPRSLPAPHCSTTTTTTTTTNTNTTTIAPARPQTYMQKRQQLTLKIRKAFTKTVHENRQFIASLAYCVFADVSSGTLEEQLAIVELIRCAYGISFTKEVSYSVAERCYECVKFLDTTTLPLKVVMPSVLMANNHDIKSLCFMVYKFLFRTSFCTACRMDHLAPPNLKDLRHKVKSINDL